MKEVELSIPSWLENRVVRYPTARLSGYRSLVPKLGQPKWGYPAQARTMDHIRNPRASLACILIITCMWAPTVKTVARSFYKDYPKRMVLHTIGIQVYLHVPNMSIHTSSPFHMRLLTTEILHDPKHTMLQQFQGLLYSKVMQDFYQQ